MRPTHDVPQTRGFTLIEVLVSITILAGGVVALSSMLGRAARSATAASALVYQTAALTSEAGRLGALPFDQLVAGNTCVVVTTAPFRHTRCSLITNISAKLRRVTVTVTPTGPTLLQAQTATFERSISGDASPPLFTP